MPPKASVGAGGQLNSRNSTNQGLLSSKKNSTAVVAPAGDSRLKVVVRRCPPELPEELFWKTVEPWVNSDTVDWKLYKPGKARKQGSNKANINSVVYIHFKKQAQLTAFASAFHDHVFRNSKGACYQTTVGYALYQKVANRKIKPDPLAGIIEDDPDFIAFQKKLTEPEPAPSADTVDFQPATKVKQVAPNVLDLRELKKSQAAAKGKTGGKAGRNKSTKQDQVTGASGTATAGKNGKAAIIGSHSDKKDPSSSRKEKKKEKKSTRDRKKEGPGPAAATTVKDGQQHDVKNSPSQTGQRPPTANKAAVRQKQAPKAPEVPKPEVPKTILLAPRPQSSKLDPPSKGPSAPTVPSKPPAQPSIVPASNISPAVALAKPQEKVLPKKNAFDDFASSLMKSMQAPTKAANKPGSAGQGASESGKSPSTQGRPETKRGGSSNRGGKAVTNDPGLTSPALQDKTAPSAASSARGGRGRGRNASQRGGLAGRGGSAGGAGHAAPPVPATTNGNTAPP